nr:hypothetical protein [Pseudomonas viridiflava]
MGIVERRVGQFQTVPFRGKQLHGQRNGILATPDNFKYLYLSGLVHDPVRRVDLFVKVETVDLLFRHQ